MLDYQTRNQLEYFLSPVRPCLEVLFISTSDNQLRTTSRMISGKVSPKTKHWISPSQTQHMKKAKEELNELGGSGYIKDAKGRYYSYNNGQIKEISKKEVVLN